MQIQMSKFKCQIKPKSWKVILDLSQHFVKVMLLRDPETSSG